MNAKQLETMEAAIQDFKTLKAQSIEAKKNYRLRGEESMSIYYAGKEVAFESVANHLEQLKNRLFEQGKD